MPQQCARATRRCGESYADDVLSLKRWKVGSRHHPFPDLSFDRGKKCFRRDVGQELTMGNDREVRCRGLDIRDDMR